MEEKTYAEPRKLAMHGAREEDLFRLPQRKVYIAGPLYSSGRVSVNIRKAIAAALVLRHLNEIPFVPHLFHFADMQTPHPPDFWLQWDFDVLKECNIMVRLPGYSKGSDMEEYVARDQNIPVFFGLEHYVEWLRPGVKLDRETCELFDIPFVEHRPKKTKVQEEPAGTYARVHTETWQTLLARVGKLERFAQQVSAQTVPIAMPVEERRRRISDGIENAFGWRAGSLSETDQKAEAAFARGATRVMPEGLSHGHPGVAYEAPKTMLIDVSGVPEELPNRQVDIVHREPGSLLWSIADQEREDRAAGKPPRVRIMEDGSEPRNPEPQNSQDHASPSHARAQELLSRYEEEGATEEELANMRAMFARVFPKPDHWQAEAFDPDRGVPTKMEGVAEILDEPCGAYVTEPEEAAHYRLTCALDAGHEGEHHAHLFASGGACECGAEPEPIDDRERTGIATAQARALVFYADDDATVEQQLTEYLAGTPPTFQRACECIEQLLEHCVWLSMNADAFDMKTSEGIRMRYSLRLASGTIGEHEGRSEYGDVVSVLRDLRTRVGKEVAELKG